MYELSKPQKLIYDMEKYAGEAVSVICGSMIVKGSKTPEELQAAVNKLYWLNDALRIHMVKTDGGIQQIISECPPENIEILYFDSKCELDTYGCEYAKIPLNLYGSLCEIKAVSLSSSYGILVKAHHMIGDAWALSLLCSQFNAILAGETPVAYSYIEYLEAEKSYLCSSRYIRDKSFFLEQFQACDEVTYLSEKHTDSLRSNRMTFWIDTEPAKKLTTYAKEHNVSPFVLFMAVLAVYIHRIKMNTEKFYIGTAILNRTGIRERNTVGMFINTVPMLAELDSSASFVENLLKIKERLFMLLRHQKYNYGDVLADIRREYGFGEKLYDVMFSYQNAVITGQEDTAESSWYHSGSQAESLQIHIDDRDSEGVFRIHYDYQIEKFSETDIARLHKHMTNLLFDAIENDGKKLYELEMLPISEKNLLLHDFNDTAVDYFKDKRVHQLFEDQVQRTPDKTAVIACDKTLTYTELNEQANRIAHSLIAQGVKPGDIVAFALSRRSYLIAVMFGILKAGAAYLPIDPDYPQERINYLIKESNAKLCLSEENLTEFIRNVDTSNPEIVVKRDDYFCALHTSGSTGTPKLSLLKQCGLSNFVEANQRFWKNIDTVVSTTIVTFDVFIMDSILSIVQGCQLVLASESDIYNQSNFEKLFRYSEHNMFFSTPTKMENYLDNSQTKKFLEQIQRFVVGGEIFNNSLLNKLRKYSPGRQIFNIYGPTEATIWVTVDKVEQGRDVTIGRPIANTQIYIVDKYMSLVPIGVMGELCIAGAGVGAGYLNRQELTAEKFIDNPFGLGKLYRTGDLAYWREDGNIVYVGRNDFQVKIRGLRIELGEIESAITNIEGISKAVVTVRKDEKGRQILCAFYTGTEIAHGKIRSIIAEKLPRYMLPHIFVHLAQIPLTCNGKINRKILPKIDLSAIASSVEYIAPQTEQQKILSTAIESVLGIQRVGIRDNFFDLGGDSLKAIDLIAKLEQKGYHTEIKTVFASDTVEDLAEALVNVDVIGNTPILSGDAPATPAQMRVYIAQSMDSGLTTYNVPYVFKVEKVDTKKLWQAVTALIKRHDILRTRFENRDGMIVQVVADTVSFEVEQLTDSDISKFIRPFDLSKAPLLRVGCYENMVMVDMHHIITDGSSMPVFFHELNELYMGRALSDTPVPYHAFAMQETDHTASKKYWLSVYSGELPVLELNTDFARTQRRSFRGSAFYDSVDWALHCQILEKCKALNITPYVFYMGGFNILLSKFSGNSDIVVGIPISGRDSRYLHTLGMFVNTVALRSFPSGDKSVGDFLREVKEASVNAITYQDYPYGDLVKQLNANSTNRNPLFDVMFAYQSETMTQVVFGDQKAELLSVPVTTSKYDFTFTVMPMESRAMLMVEYCTGIYRESTMRRLADGYQLILKQMLQSSTLIQDISAVTEQDRRKLQFDFNDTAVDYPKDKCVHQLFEEQVRKTPDKTAVIACDKTLTYIELNEQANRITHSLITQGVKLGDIVAFALSRKSYLIAVMFGILKAGAAYLPIDPDYPQDRIDHMLQDSQAKYFITEKNILTLLKNDFEKDITTAQTSENICYCIYTSGTTGKPKGILIKHKNVVNFVQNNWVNTFQKNILESCDHFIFANSVSFDITLQEIYLPLLNGNSLILLSEEQIYNIGTAVNLLKGRNCGLIITPSKLEVYMANIAFCNSMRNITFIMCGAEVFSKQLQQKIQKYTNAIIFNGYGPTETTCGVLYSKIDTCDDITIGRPIANTQIYIVDKYMHLAPIGVTGELCIAGAGVGAGYLNRPELTAEKFIDNPFGQGKLYKTGDLAYWREDGNIVYVGRNDFQVKIRGLRIELGEIESAICSVSGIVQVVVVVRKDNTGRQLICAFYTENTLVTVEQLRSAINQKLPKYMMPHIFTCLPEMPLTPSGKINRKALPEVDLSDIKHNTEYVKPEGEMEKQLAEIMSKVLNYSPVSRDDDFFDLGGDSLKAIEFVSKAHSNGIYFTMQNVFDYPTVWQLVQCIENGDQQEFSYADIDFTQINRILAKNMAKSISPPKKMEMGNLLLTGATGFLGIHILADFLEHDTGTAYCLVRGRDQAESEKRLAELLTFYFGDTYESSQRIQVICADLQEECFGLSESEYGQLLADINTVINAAASVKHYGSYRYFYETNVESTRRLIAFCMKAGAKLIHISTLSVSGNSFADTFDGYVSETEKHFYESSLYIGQPLDNVYARSKFEAEMSVLDAMNNGLQANIMRMGNLTNRFSDGQFQKNHESNAFLKRIKAIFEMKVFPEYLMDIYVEFTPIDEAANAIMTIARHFNQEQTVFHINSTKVVYMDRLIPYFHELGIALNIVSDAEFTAALRRTMKQSGMEYIFETFINDMDSNEKLNYDSNIRIENEFTTEYLKQLGFEWKEIDLNYLEKYVHYFRKIGYWEV